MAVDTTNGPWTCHINDGDDAVNMTASAHDYDQCIQGDRINSAATKWEVTSGTLEHATGSTSAWTAGTSIGEKTLTVTFDDLDDGADYDDDSTGVAFVQKTLTAFKVGVHLGTSKGSNLTKWETDSSGGTIGVGGSLNVDHILTTPDHSVQDNCEATWTLRVEPDGTPMKGNVRAWAGAWGGQGRIVGITADSDWDVGGGGSASFSVTLTLGLVSFSYNGNLDGDDNLSYCSVGVGFASQIHNDYSDKIELTSDTTTGPTATKGISHAPDDAAIVGKPNTTTKRAEWEVGHKMEKKTTEGNWAAAECEGNMNYTWTVTNTLPEYVHGS
jgi:hypothetical protein